MEKRSIVILLAVVVCLSTAVHAACSTLAEITADQQACGNQCMHSGMDLIKQSDCVNACNAEWFRRMAAISDCEKQMKAEEEQRKYTEDMLAKRAELDRIAAEERARDAGAEWAAQGRPDDVWLGDDITYAGTDVKLLRDGKVVDVMNYRDELFRFGPGDVFMTALGPVRVESQVENIAFGKDTIVQYIGMKFNPPRIDAQPGDWDYARNFRLDENREWAFLGGVIKDLGEFTLVSATHVGTMAGCLLAPVTAVTAPVCAGGIVAYIAMGTAYFDSKIKDDRGVNVILTPSVAVTHVGTEFTVAVDGNGSTTVTVLNGSVLVMDIMSRKGVVVIIGQSITVPKTATGLTTEQLLAHISYAPPESVDMWWAEKPRAPAKSWSVPIALAITAVIIVIALLIGRRKKRRR